MNIQNIKDIEQSINKIYGLINELVSNHSIELIDIIYPNHNGVQDAKAKGELMYLRQSTNSLKKSCDILIEKLNNAITD